MFAELKGLLEERDVILSLSAVDKEKICVVVQRKPKPSAAKEADKLAPLTITQSVEWLDENFAKTLGEYKSMAQSLDDALAVVKTESEEAIKAAKAEAAVKLDAAKKAAASKATAKHVPPAKKTEPANPEPAKDAAPSVGGLFDAAPSITGDTAAAPGNPTAPASSSTSQENPVEVSGENPTSAIAAGDSTTEKENDVANQPATTAA